MNAQLIAGIGKANAAGEQKKLHEYGIELGKLYTDKGLPLDMALDRVTATHEVKLVILNGALSWFITHKRNSGATEKAIERQRRANAQYLDNFINNKEIGAY